MLIPKFNTMLLPHEFVVAGSNPERVQQKFVTKQKLHLASTVSS